MLPFTNDVQFIIRRQHNRKEWIVHGTHTLWIISISMLSSIRIPHANAFRFTSCRTSITLRRSMPLTRSFFERLRQHMIGMMTSRSLQVLKYNGIRNTLSLTYVYTKQITNVILSMGRRHINEMCTRDLCILLSIKHRKIVHDHPKMGSHDRQQHTGRILTTHRQTLARDLEKRKEPAQDTR
ncbi:hypothetical protein DEU56DRAFT_767260 [Suillus clintonianus]|uniref:uncharacterized protein n=1 Tax=Suillus clintonianus TaxID=1904413 RepID=UPI001B864F06|nr:uncharacterized protein DEU56DRAFT_767260 [Suillus clintonianus]KAG2155410.1 hypothetical protein DEU56DRAFT_767260 [Suillus clintonianus]